MFLKMWCKLTFLTLILLLGNYASYYEVQASPKPKSHLTSFLHRVKRQGDSFLHELMYFYTFWTILWNHNFNTWNFYFLIEQNSFFSIYWLTFRKVLYIQTPRLLSAGQYFIAADINHMTCYNLNWPKIKL